MMRGFVYSLPATLSVGVSFILSFCLLSSKSEEPKEFIGAFYSLEEVLAVFHKEKYKDDPAVTKALRLYDALVEDVGNISLYENNNPFIAIEGNQKSRKFIMARQLSRALKAINLRNPPEFMNFLKFQMKDVETRRAFYSLALYANALEARRILHEKPVVTAGYWMDIAAFALAKKYPNGLPENTSELEWPKDLLAPDIIFYIHSLPMPSPVAMDPNYGTTRPPNPMTPLLAEVYKRWKYPRVVELNGRIFSFNEMFSEMFRQINFLKQTRFRQYLKREKKNLT